MRWKRSRSFSLNRPHTLPTPRLSAGGRWALGLKRRPLVGVDHATASPVRVHSSVIGRPPSPSPSTRARGSLHSRSWQQSHMLTQLLSTRPVSTQRPDSLLRPGPQRQGLPAGSHTASSRGMATLRDVILHSCHGPEHPVPAQTLPPPHPAALDPAGVPSNPSGIQGLLNRQCSRV